MVDFWNLVKMYTINIRVILLYYYNNNINIIYVKMAPFKYNC